MKKTYTIFAALSDETNEGWIWFKCPPLRSRTIVKVRNPNTGSVVYCESREIDDNFIAQYNKSPRLPQWFIANGCEALVISGWYRDALGGFATKGNKIELDIRPGRVQWLSALRACCQHPEIAVRLGTRLGVLGAWLGLVGLMAALLDLNSYIRVLSLATVAVGGAIASCLACRGVKPPKQ